MSRPDECCIMFAARVEQRQYAWFERNRVWYDRNSRGLLIVCPFCGRHLPDPAMGRNVRDRFDIWRIIRHAIQEQEAGRGDAGGVSRREDPQGDGDLEEGCV